MNFGDALHCLRNGAKVAREGWNGNGMFIYLVQPSNFIPGRAPLDRLFPGQKVEYRAHIDMRTADGSLVPWVASQTDLLAWDWVKVE